MAPTESQLDRSPVESAPSADPNRPLAGSQRAATVYRMVKPGHVCPYGLKVVHLLKSEGYRIDDHHLESDAETKAFKAKHGVETTPQVWLDGERVGGYEATRERLGLEMRSADDTTYRPVVVLFAVAAAIAAAFQWRAAGALDWTLVPRFVAVAMTLLAVQKLRDVESFSTMFLNYDLLARRWVPYGYVYPYAEAVAGVLMIAGVLPLLSAPIALFIGGVGAVSVFKAVYVDRRELKCACVGGNSNVPLGFVSLTENLLMVGMGVWTLVRVLSA